MTSHFRMTLPACGSLLGLRIDDEEQQLGTNGSVIILFKENGDHAVSPTIVLDAADKATNTVVLESEDVTL